jgi:MFS transporter, DHA2 family, multidrug resistance protein
MIGLVCFGSSMWLFAPIMNQWGFKEMLLSFAFRGIVVPFAMASTVTLTMGNLPPDRLKSASGLFVLMRNLGGAIGIAVSATVVNDRTNLHFLRIAEHLNFSNTELAGWLYRMTSRGEAGNGAVLAEPCHRLLDARSLHTNPQGWGNGHRRRNSAGL